MQDVDAYAPFWFRCRDGVVETTCGRVKATFPPYSPATMATKQEWRHTSDVAGIDLGCTTEVFGIIDALFSGRRSMRGLAVAMWRLCDEITETCDYLLLHDTRVGDGIKRLVAFADSVSLNVNHDVGLVNAAVCATVYAAIGGDDDRAIALAALGVGRAPRSLALDRASRSCRSDRVALDTRHLSGDVATVNRALVLLYATLEQTHEARDSIVQGECATNPKAASCTVAKGIIAAIYSVFGVDDTRTVALSTLVASRNPTLIVGGTRRTRAALVESILDRIPDNSTAMTFLHKDDVCDACMGSDGVSQQHRSCRKADACRWWLSAKRRGLAIHMCDEDPVHAACRVMEVDKDDADVSSSSSVDTVIVCADRRASPSWRRLATIARRLHVFLIATNGLERDDPYHMCLHFTITHVLPTADRTRLERIHRWVFDDADLSVERAHAILDACSRHLVTAGVIASLAITYGRTKPYVLMCRDEKRDDTALDSPSVV